MTDGHQILDLMPQLAEKVGVIRKDSKNQHQNYSFRGVDAVVKAVHQPLIELGITLSSELISFTQFDGETKKGDHNRTTYVHMRYTFTAPDGSSVSADGLGESTDTSDKSAPKAMSVAFRVALLQVTHSPTDDDDPDATSPSPGRRRKAKVETPAEAPAPGLDPAVRAAQLAVFNAVPVTEDGDLETRKAEARRVWTLAKAELGLGADANLSADQLIELVAKARSLIT